MTALIVNDVIQVSINGLQSGRPCVNVFHIDASRPITGDAATKAAALLKAYQDRLVPLFNTSYDVLGATYIDLDSLTGDSGQVPPDAGEPIVGTRANGAPPQVAVLVRKNVSASPRGVSFRMFLPPPGDADIDVNGQLTNTYRDLLQDALDAFRDDVDEAAGVGTSESHLCCVSYPRFDSGVNKGQVSGPGTAFDLDTYTVQATVATQRRRLRP